MLVIIWIFFGKDSFKIKKKYNRILFYTDRLLSKRNSLCQFLKYIFNKMSDNPHGRGRARPYDRSRSRSNERDKEKERERVILKNFQLI